MAGDAHNVTAGSPRPWWWALAAPAAGVLGCAVLAVRSPLEPGDPLRTTLAVLPLVLGLLVAIDRRLAPAGRIGSGEWAAFVLVAAAMVAHPRLGLDSAERLVVAAWAIAVGHRALRVLVGLRASLGTPLRPRAPLELFLLALAVYLAILPWSTERRPPDGDEPWNLLIAHSVAYDLDTDLANNYAQRDSLRFLDRALEPQPGDPEGKGGALYSRHNPAFPAALAPFYRVGGKLGVLAAVALLSAAVAWLSFGLLARAWPREGSAALLQWALLALAPPLLLYSHQVWVEVPAALLMALALDRLLALERREGSERVAWVAFAAALLLLPLIKLRFGVLSGSLLALAFVRLPDARRRLLQIAAAFGVAAAGYLFANARLFGHALRIHTADELLLFRIPLRDYLAHGSGLFFDHAFGLFACAPLWLLIVPGAVAAWRRNRRLVVDVAILTLPYFVLVASRREWYGGWSPPFRYMLALLPPIALLGVPAWAARNRPRARLVIAPLAIGTGLLALLFVVEPGWAYSFADGRSRLVDLVSVRFGADVAQLLPSATRTRLATWVWPLLVVPAVLALWPWRAGSRRLAPAASLLGVALALAGLLALPWTARARPTRHLEVESPHVVKTGGHPDPDPWVFDRRRFPEAWALREGESLAAPVRAGGVRVTLELHGRFIRNRPLGLDLEVLCGDRPLATLRWEEHDRWTVRDIGPFEWTPGEPLVLRVPPPQGPGEPGVVNGVILDRVDFRWSD
ncbi:MAG TPA: hypothetical protein VMV46_00145 [Thermoanaerobaculia bacterium]|nr:hypothetical protein [Thermoanaerobaculia bacterium]